MKLPGRLRAVARLLLEGYRNDGIALTLGVSDKIVKRNVGKLCDLTGQDNRVAVAMWMLRHPDFLARIYR